MSNGLKRLMLAMAMLAAALCASPAAAQVPVIDQATLSQATTTANNTASIMNTNSQILTQVTATLNAVTGNRQTGPLSSAALGSGFSMAAAPDLSSILGGGAMSWGNLGAYGQNATAIINALNLVKTLSGNVANPTGSDNAYSGAINTASALAGVIGGAQGAATTRSASFTSAAGQIGSQPDVKGAIDANSQLQVQTGLTINELIGVMNAANASLNATAMQELAGQAAAAQIMTYDASKARLVAP